MDILPSVKLESRVSCIQVLVSRVTGYIVIVRSVDTKLLNDLCNIKRIKNRMKVHRYRHETTSRVSRGVRPSASSRSTGGGPSSTACPTASRRRSEGSGRVPTRGTDPRTAGFVRSCTLHDLCRRRRTETPTSETDENAGVTGPGSRFRPNCQSVVRSVWVVVRE